ncbi:MAG: GNAT family N-acetyltransferase [Bacteroidales bacterium]|nr:GNAT family N-acetyltransferase [Bacteroidales bacterium]
MRFVSQTQNAESVIAEVLCDEEVHGYFYGLIIKRYGLRILGSPFPGWTTSYMGFHLHKSINSTDLLSSLKQFAFNDLKCIHIEIMDRHLKPEDFVSANYQYRIQPGFEVNLLKNEDEIFNNFKSSCRRCIRKADKNGVKIEIAQDKAFAKDYFTQLQEVFAKQNLVPTYSIKRIETLIDNLLPTGKLLLLRAKDREGKCIATGIFPAYNDTMFFFGGASYTRYQILRPNEAIQWFAMRYWKQKGISKYDMGGGGDYKLKYGGQEVTVPWGRISKYPILERLRNIGQHVVGIKQHFMGWRNRIN